VLPKITVNWTGIATVVTCSVLIVAAMHSLAAWLYQGAGASRETETQQRWRWSWSLALYGALWLLFLAAMGITGVVHQTGWLMTSNAPLRVVREYPGDYLRHLKGIATELHMAAAENEWGLEATRKAFYESQSDYSIGGSRPNAIEDLEILFLEGSKNELAAVAAFFRDPLKREKSGFVLVARNGREAYETKEVKELAAILARYQPDNRSLQDRALGGRTE
jgi:hypothetical protein